MRRQPVLEKNVVSGIIAALKRYPHIVVRKRHGTAMGVAGDPDLYGTVGGRHFEIEVKRPNDSSSQLTELQMRRLQEWKLAGAITGVARSADDALAILGLTGPEPHPERTVCLCASSQKCGRPESEPPAHCGNTHCDREAA